MTCRTAALGGHADICDTCGYFEGASYNSCRNRHCPKCQSLAQAKWIEGRVKRILPTGYFHVVFTLPHSLCSLAMRNRREIFTLLIRTAAATLQDLAADRKRLGAQLGITTVLHTWTRDLRFHPHVHCIVTGGGLAPKRDRWVPLPRKGNYLFPAMVLSRLFRAKFLDGLATLWNERRLDLGGDSACLAKPVAFYRFKDGLYRGDDWVVWAKRPFAGIEQVFQYLGRYTHRVGISNHRLISIADGAVRFSTKDGKAVTVTPEEFIRRFLLHVLPKGFVKIRHYGLMASANAKTKLEVARCLLEPDPSPQDTPDTKETPEQTAPETTPESTATHMDWRARLMALTGLDLSRCPKCKQGTMVRHSLHYLAALRSQALSPPAPVDSS